jgi:NADH-quinone oxidoreductase subunit L
VFGVPEILGGSHMLHHFLSGVLTTEHTPELGHNTEFGLMGVSVVVALIAAVLAYSKFSKKPELGEPTGFGKVLANKWYIDELYDAVIVNPLLKLADFLKNVVEKSGIDGIVNGVGRFVQYLSRQLRLLQSGQVGSYILFMVLSIVVLFLVFWNQAIILQFLQKVF